MNALTELRIALGATGVLTMILAGCAPDRGTWQPLPEQASTRAPEDSATKALEHVRKARSMVEGSGEEVVAELAAAENALAHLSGYYLPLMEARARAYNAYSFSQAGHNGRASDELAEVEKIVLGIAEKAPYAEGAMSELAEELGRTRVALASGDADAPVFLSKLVSLFNNAILKGPIELRAE